MAGQGRFHGNFNRLLVTNLADQNDFWVLAQKRPQDGGEGQADFLIGLGLAQPFEIIFDRVFRRHNIGAGVVDILQRTIQRRGFARTGRAGHQHHALRRGNRFDQLLQIAVLKADFIDRQRRVPFQQADTNTFAVFARQHIKARIDILAILGLKGDGAVLRQALFGNIAIGENFEARDHGQIIVKQILAELFLRGQHAIDAKADARRIAIGLDVNVTGIGVERMLQDIIDEFDDETGIVNIVS